MNEEWYKSFGEQLDKFYAWPALYTFKFIVKSEKEEAVKKLFPTHINTTKTSQKGNYSSLTFQMMMPSAQAVIAVYKKAYTIEGLIAL